METTMVQGELLSCRFQLPLNAIMIKPSTFLNSLSLPKVKFKQMAKVIILAIGVVRQTHVLVVALIDLPILFSGLWNFWFQQCRTVEIRVGNWSQTFWFTE